MIRAEKNELINSIVNDFYMQEWFRGEDPIIAGGSILYLYLNFRDEASHSSRQITSTIRSIKKLKESGLNLNHRKLCDSPILDYAGDIDIWFSSKERLERVLKKAPKRELESFPDGRKLSTNWAETFYVKNDLFPKVKDIQIIKGTPKTPQELIRTFDMSNSMIAWQDNTIYVDDRLISSFSNGLIEYVNDPFVEDMTIASKLFNCIRLFKYANKYHLSFSEDIHKNILSVFLEVDDLDLDLYEQKIEIANGTYGVQLASSNTVKSMAYNLAGKVSRWYSMETFDKANLAFLIGLKSPYMNSATEFVKRVLDADYKYKEFPF